MEPAVWQSLLCVVDADDNGTVDWNELVQFISEVFVHIEREKALQGVLQQHQSESADLAIKSTDSPVEDTGPAVALKMRQSKDVVRVQLETNGE